MLAILGSIALLIAGCICAHAGISMLFGAVFVALQYRGHGGFVCFAATLGAVFTIVAGWDIYYVLSHMPINLIYTGT